MAQDTVANFNSAFFTSCSSVNSIMGVAKKCKRRLGGEMLYPNGYLRSVWVVQLRPHFGPFFFLSLAHYALFIDHEQ